MTQSLPIYGHRRIPEVLHWAEIWHLWRLFECRELIVMLETSVWDDRSCETSCRDENTAVPEAWMWSAMVLRRWLNCIKQTKEFQESTPLTIMRCPHRTHSDHLKASDTRNHPTEQCPPQAFIVHQCCFSFMLSIDASSTSVGPHCCCPSAP